MKKILTLNGRDVLKCLVSTRTGPVESVGIKTPGNRSICISSQAGCAMGCGFCAAGTETQRAPRNLSCDEMIREIEIMRTRCGFSKKEDVSLMGMGEPTLNWNIKELFEKLGEKHSFSVSTVGLTNRLERFIDMFGSSQRPPRLQLSVHFSCDAKRRAHMKSARFNRLADLLRLAEKYAIKSDNQVCLNYVLFKGINDSPGDIERLVILAKDRPFYVKLSEANPWGIYQPTTEERSANAKKILENSGISVKVFASLGTSIGAGCGQMSASYLKVA